MRCSGEGRHGCQTLATCHTFAVEDAKLISAGLSIAGASFCMLECHLDVLQRHSNYGQVTIASAEVPRTD